MDWRREHNKRALDELIPLLEAKHGAEVALGEASRWSQLAHIDRLVQQGVNVNCRTGEHKWTPLLMAGTKPAAKKLLELGADVNASNAHGHTALMLVLIQNFRKQEYIARIKLLLNYGADVSITDNIGKTAYDYAIERPDMDAAELLALPRNG